MKFQNNTVGLLVVCILLAIGCTEKSKKESPKPIAKEQQRYGNNSENHIINDSVFNARVQLWNQKYRDYMLTDSLHYFELSKVDLMAILKEDVPRARFYLGMTSDGETLIPHVMVAGVTDLGVPLGDIYDYSTACPPTCGQ